MLEQNEGKMGGKKQLNYSYLKPACPLKQNYNNPHQVFTATQQRGKHTSAYKEKKNQSIKINGAI